MSDLREKLARLYWQIENQLIADEKEAKEYWVDEFEHLIQSEKRKEREEMERQWDKAVSILYCEHCGKLMSQDRVDKMKIEKLRKDK